MANTNAPFGFRPVKGLSGSSMNIGYYAVASNASRIGKGDLVELTSGGQIQRSTSATSVGPWIGVAAIDSGTISAAISKFPVYDDPNCIFEVQGPTAALALTDLNRIVKANCGTAPDSNTGISKNVLTNTAATASNGVKLLRYSSDPSNEVGASAKIEVRLNAHANASGQAGV